MTQTLQPVGKLLREWRELRRLTQLDVALEADISPRHLSLALPELYEGVAPELLAAPNALRLSLHPQGLAPRIENLAEWRGHLLARVERQIAMTADPELVRLRAECEGYGPARDVSKEAPGTDAVLIPLRVRTSSGVLSLFSTTTVFGTPIEVTLSELAIESFSPADEATARAVRQKMPL